MQIEKFLQNKLELGSKFFKLEAGIVSKVTGSDYLIIAAKTEMPFFKVDDIFQLENTFCRDVVERKATLSYNKISSNSKMKLHPAYRKLFLESYIGTPIIIKNKVWGTFNFSSIQAKLKNFTKNDSNFIEQNAQEIAEYFEENDF